jgi:hypothetical protein
VHRLFSLAFNVPGPEPGRRWITRLLIRFNRRIVSRRKQAAVRAKIAGAAMILKLSDAQSSQATVFMIRAAGCHALGLNPKAPLAPGQKELVYNC